VDTKSNPSEPRKPMPPRATLCPRIWWRSTGASTAWASRPRRRA